MTEFWVLFTAILFFFLGRHTVMGTESELAQLKQTINKSLHKKPRPGVLPFKTTEELKYERSVEKKIDDEWNKLQL